MNTSFYIYFCMFCGQKALGYLTPDYTPFQLSTLDRGISVQNKCMERCYAILNRADFLFNV